MATNPVRPTPRLLRWLGFKRLHVGTCDFTTIESNDGISHTGVVVNLDGRYEVKWRWSWRWTFGRYW